MGLSALTTSATGIAASGGAGIGAGGAAAGLGAASSVMGPLAIAGAVVGGALGFMSAKKTNKALRRQLIERYKAYDKQINENRAAFYDATMRAGKSVADEISQTSLVLSGYGSGISNNEYIAQISADKEYDQTLRRREMTKFEENAQIAKSNDRVSTQSQVVNPIMSTISGAVSMGQLGASVGGAIDSFTTTLANNQALKSFDTQWRSELSDGAVSPLTSARFSAISAGIEPRFLVDQSSPALAPFLAQNNAESISRNILNNQMALSNLQLAATRSTSMTQLTNFDAMSRKLNTPFTNFAGNAILERYRGR